jgi:bacterioferritin
MQGNPDVIKHLNTILGNELIAINQYFLHGRMLDSWGYIKLGKKSYDESIDEMKHADLLVQRILFLDGLPNLQDLGKILIGQNVTEIFQCDLKLEHQAHKDLLAAIVFCESAQDFASRDLLLSILKSEEEHIDWLETQLALITDLGGEAYLQTQIHS